jgi:hypothetical protein
MFRRPPPRQVFDTSPIGGSDAAEIARVTPNPGDDEDPAVVRAQDGRFHVVWWSRQRGQVDLFARSSSDGRTWSDERRITNDPEEDYYPSLLQSADGTFHLVWFRLERARATMDIWYARSWTAGGGRVRRR